MGGVICPSKIPFGEQHDRAFFSTRLNKKLFAQAVQSQPGESLSKQAHDWLGVVRGTYRKWKYKGQSAVGLKE
jgi:hypothetical protein